MNLKIFLIYPLLFEAVRQFGVTPNFAVLAQDAASAKLPDLNCNAFNYQAGSEIREGKNTDPNRRPVYPNPIVALRCNGAGEALIPKLHDSKQTNPIRLGKVTQPCNAASFEAGQNKEYPDRQTLSKCFPGDLKNPKAIFPVREDDKLKQCPSNLTKPCEGERVPKNDPCNGKNLLAGLNAIMDQERQEKLPAYQSSAEAIDCLPKAWRYAVKTQNRFEILSLLEGADDPSGCRGKSLEAGLRGAYKTRGDLQRLCRPTENPETLYGVREGESSEKELCTIDPKKPCVKNKTPMFWG